MITEYYRELPMLKLRLDFKSCVSTNSTTPACFANTSLRAQGQGRHPNSEARGCAGQSTNISPPPWLRSRRSRYPPSMHVDENLTDVDHYTPSPDGKQ